MDGNNFESMMNGIPSELRDAITAIFSQIPFNVVNSFVEQYDSNSPADQLIVRVVALVIVSIGKGIDEDLEKAGKEQNPKYGKIQAAVTAAKKLREVADQIESQIDSHECEECCKHKH